MADEEQAKSASLPALTSRDQRELSQLGVDTLPVLVQREGPKGWRAFLDFFLGTDVARNLNTQAAYRRAVCEFLELCEGSGVYELRHIEASVVGSYIAYLGRPKSDGGRGLSKASVKLKLAGIRKFFNFLVVEQVLPRSPATSVAGPKLKTTKGKTRVLLREELQKLLDSIDRTTIIGKRDYAWLTLAASSWCRVGALAKLRVRDYEHSGKRSFLHVEEKGGKVDRMPVHHKAQEALDAYLEAAGLEEGDSPIFQSVSRQGSLTGRVLHRSKVFEMVRRRARQAGVPENISCHTFRGTGITLFLQAGGKLERAQAIAHHADSRTTKIYDHSEDGITLEDIELVQF
ncbi:MAG: site-specific integrase [bacterium]|nr:site-specific integrase [bacterium]